MLNIEKHHDQSPVLFVAMIAIIGCSNSPSFIFLSENISCGVDDFEVPISMKSWPREKGSNSQPIISCRKLRNMQVSAIKESNFRLSHLTRCNDARV